MKIKFLDGEKLYYAFFYGRKEVLKKRKHLNEINVFPVPDGDTGTNLAITMNSIVDGSKVNPHVSDVSQGMAQAAISGSRGNSGIIFAQFVHGLNEAVKGKKALNPKEFAHAVRNGVEHAYKALSRPVEGTILTVMKAWASAVHKFHDKAGDFVELMHHGLDAAKVALHETPKKLKVLKKAGVVDAGAEGFVHFLEGVTRFLRHGKKPDLSKEIVPVFDVEEDFKATGGELEYRYCTEALLRCDTNDKDTIRSKLESFGDSLIVAGDEHTLKLHVHTNTPQDVFFSLRDTGQFIEQKVDDMKRQYEIQYNRKGTIALVTDSTCDLPDELLDKYQIHMVPVNLHFGDVTYLDRVALTQEQFYGMLDDAEEYPKTSQPSVEAFEKTYQHLAKYYDSIVSIHLADKLSGTMNAARLAAEKHPEWRISVIDSRVLSGALGLMLLRVAKEIEKGRPHEDVVRFAESLPDKAGVLVSVKTLEYMVRGGRVSPLKGIVAKMLNLKPIISLEKTGATTILAKAVSEKSCLNKILGMIEKKSREKPVHSFAVVHAHVAKEADKLQERVEQILGKKASFNVNIAPVIGVHAGIGAMAVTYLME